MPAAKVTGKGRATKVKVKQETGPTPLGRRVIPRVTSAMKADANRKADLHKDNKRGKKIKVGLLKFGVSWRSLFVNWGGSWLIPTLSVSCCGTVPNWM